MRTAEFQSLHRKDGPITAKVQVTRTPTRACRASILVRAAGRATRLAARGTLVAAFVRQCAVRCGAREAEMNQDILQGKWMQLKGRVKERWGRLTDDDLDQIGGQAQQLVGRIQERYGIARDEAQSQVDALFANEVEPARTGNR